MTIPTFNRRTVVRATGIAALAAVLPSVAEACPEPEALRLYREWRDANHAWKTRGLIPGAVEERYYAMRPEYPEIVTFKGEGGPILLERQHIENIFRNQMDMRARYAERNYRARLAALDKWEADNEAARVNSGLAEAEANETHFAEAEDAALLALMQYEAKTLYGVALKVLASDGYLPDGWVAEAQGDISAEGLAASAFTDARRLLGRV